MHFSHAPYPLDIIDPSRQTCRSLCMHTCTRRRSGGSRLTPGLEHGHSGVGGTSTATVILVEEEEEEEEDEEKEREREREGGDGA